MLLDQVDFKKANKFLPYILILGLAIGFASFFMGFGEELSGRLVINTITSLIIGYSLLVIVFNRDLLLAFCNKKWQVYSLFLLLFIVVACIATEVEIIIRDAILSQSGYKPLSGGKMYLVNSIITAAIGFGNYLTFELLDENASPPVEPEKAIDNRHPILQIPSKQGENIILTSTQDVVYFEAYDNYSFVFVEDRKKSICDYSLRFLESRLGPSFVRIHRKHIVNRSKITSIRSHLNGRYILSLSDGSEVNSSKTYAATIKDIIKLQ